MRAYNTTADAADAWEVTPDTVRRWVDAGRARATRTATGRLRFSAAEIERLRPQRRIIETNMRAIHDAAIERMRRRVREYEAAKHARQNLADPLNTAHDISLPPVASNTKD
jgi:excisionase family DNA binding protein